MRGFFCTIGYKVFEEGYKGSNVAFDWKLVKDVVNNVLSAFPALRLAHGKMVS
jgi:hypothetical protein